MPAHRLLERALRDRVVPLQVAIEVRRVAKKDVVRVQLIRFAAESADCLQPEDELGFRLHPAAVYLIVGRSLGAEPLDLFQHHAFELSKPVAGRCRRRQLQVSADLPGIL